MSSVNFNFSFFCNLFWFEFVVWLGCSGGTVASVDSVTQELKPRSSALPNFSTQNNSHFCNFLLFGTQHTSFLLCVCLTAWLYSSDMFTVFFLNLDLNLSLMLSLNIVPTCRQRLWSYDRWRYIINSILLLLLTVILKACQWSYVRMSCECFYFYS